MFDLTGKTALITGATGGIGGAIAQSLSQAGARVVLSGRRLDALKELASSLKGKNFTLECDLANKQKIAEFYDKAEELSGGIDILICNAGVTNDNLAIRMKDEDWQNVIDTNLTATFILNRSAFKKMIRRKWGRVINISSVVAVAGNPGQANYVASKAGMIGMTKTFAIESAAKNITFNCIAPGFIKTPMTEKLNDVQKEQIAKNIPAGRFGEPAEIASSALFLASNEAGYITGQTIHVNGGMLMI